jgi:hypothetical protein
MAFQLLTTLKLVASSQTKDIIVQFNKLVDNLTTTLQTFSNKPQITNTVIKTKVSLKSGNNLIQTGLNTPLTGWYIIRQRGAATIYDTQDTNNNDNYLALNSSAAVVIDLILF